MFVCRADVWVSSGVSGFGFDFVLVCAVLVGGFVGLFSVFGGFG